ncbi:hypothetical protein Fmac_020274 [Flemingia macrophylla]|uniref:Uncharacterized protein n=1 Tax=Flemingia macrophylla TaxID=520843 RepID=A0ABD1LTI5_9FABA
MSMSPLWIPKSGVLLLLCVQYICILGLCNIRTTRGSDEPTSSKFSMISLQWSPSSHQFLLHGSFQASMPRCSSSLAARTRQSLIIEAPKMDVLNLLPNLNVDNLIKAFAVKTNDMMLMLNKEHERAEDSKSVTVPSAAA